MTNSGRLPEVRGSFRPEYAEWAIYPKWKFDECVGLSLGVDPGMVERFWHNLIYQRELRPLGEALEQRRRLLSRFRPVCTMGGIAPAEFVALMRPAGVALPPELIGAVDAIADPVDWQGRTLRLESRVQELESEVERLRAGSLPRR